jgi:macrolide-specific efflux system membrane fusion protein
MERIAVGKKRYAVVAVVALVIVAGFIAWRSYKSGSSQEASAVQTTKVAVGTVAPTLAVTGYIESADQREVSANAGGTIIETLASVGSTVSAGQELFKLDTTEAQQSVNIAYADLVSARARLQELQDQNAPASQIASQNASITKANATYQAAVEERNATAINSPITGTVIAMNAAVGDQVSSGASGSTGSSSYGSSGSSGAGTSSSGLVTIADLEHLQVATSVDQADISKVAVDQQVQVTIDAVPGKTFSGKVASIDPIATTNSNVVTYTVYVTLDELDSGMRLGMSANLEIALAKKDNVLYVPNIAIHTRGDEKYVTKMIDGEQSEIPVTTGLESTDRTEIVSGLSEGDDIALQTFTAQTAAAGSSRQNMGFLGGGGGGGFRMQSGGSMRSFGGSR